MNYRDPRFWMRWSPRAASSWKPVQAVARPGCWHRASYVCCFPASPPVKSWRLHLRARQPVKSRNAWSIGCICWPPEATRRLLLFLANAGCRPMPRYCAMRAAFTSVYWRRSRGWRSIPFMAGFCSSSTRRRCRPISAARRWSKPTRACSMSCGSRLPRACKRRRRVCLRKDLSACSAKLAWIRRGD